MKSLPVAVQIYSVRDDAQKDFRKTMLKLKEMGYDSVEMGGLYGQPPKEIRGILDEAGLKAISAHVSINEFIDDAQKTVDDYKIIGCEYIALPNLPTNMRPKNCDFTTVIEEIKRIGKICADNGVTLMYHNHDFEFEKMDDGSYMLDYIFNNVPAELLKVQPDVCWIHVGGLNPSEYMRKYSGRCPIVHFKDYIGEKSKTSAVEFQFTSVGSGKQDMPDILKTTLEIGAKWVVVEQDFSLTQPMIEAVKASREYLKSQGW